MRISDWSSDVCSSDLIEAGVDSIEHGSFLQPDTLRLMKQKGVYLVPTRLALVWTVGHADGYPPKIAAKARAAGESHDRMFKDALEIGVPIAFGTDSAVSRSEGHTSELQSLIRHSSAV